jgi:predicted exporter
MQSNARLVRQRNAGEHLVVLEVDELLEEALVEALADALTVAVIAYVCRDVHRPLVGRAFSVLAGIGVAADGAGGVEGDQPGQTFQR